MPKLLLFFTISLFFLSLSSSAPKPQSQAMWLRYPAISPDGKTVAFCHNGDIYTVSSDGGVAYPLTRGDSYEVRPVWSPDGKTIAFSSDRNGNFDIYSVPVEGGPSKRLTFHSSNDYPQAFTPDGKSVHFISSRTDNARFIQFPYGGLGEVYSVSLEPGRELQLMSIAAEDICWNRSGTKMLFHDKKGYEDPWRKHHRSSVARDVWQFSKQDSSFVKLTDFTGEDRNAVWSSDEETIFYLSEQSGSFNVWSIRNGKHSQQTSFAKNPVRFLTISGSDRLCFGYNGDIYTKDGGDSPKKLDIVIRTEDNSGTLETKSFTDGATEMAISPNGKEIAFVVRGEVFVASVEAGTTRRITSTPGQERSVSFSPDGKKLLYASERNNAWGIYQSTLVRKDDPYFFSSTLVREEALINGDFEAFQPLYSPDGKKIAYLEDRTTVKVYTPESKESVTVLPGERNYSYSDGDQFFDWSPDSRYLLVNFLQEGNWRSEVGLVDVQHPESAVVDLTQSGFGAYGGKFMMKGKMMIYYSSRNGMRSVASHGNQLDAYGLFFTWDAYERFRLKKEDYALLKEREDAERPKTKDTTDKKQESLKIDFDGLSDRKMRLTIHSSNLSEAVVTPDGEKLFYFCSFEDGIDLWQTKFRESETKLFLKLNARNISSVQLDKDGKNLFCIADGKPLRISLDKAEKKEIGFSAEMTVNGAESRKALFDHMWRQVQEKFYVTDLQKTDWSYYKENYERFLPSINNSRDFAEMMSELLGELNASHTGCMYRSNAKNGDETAQLGVFFDETYTGYGLKIDEVMEKSPLMRTSTPVKPGTIIEKIDGVTIEANTNHLPLLNRKAGRNILLSFYDPSAKKRWDEVVVPINAGEQQRLLYARWIRRMQETTDRLSGGKVGYMHVQGMNDESYREFFDQVMGKYVNSQALIVDTRFNGGGWMHDDLATFLSGKEYLKFVPRGRTIGAEPAEKWTRRSVVLMNEGNYSDAHMFPVVYKTLGIGKLIGMPVPGTGTAVWWETQTDPTLVFGIPQVGVMDLDGNYYENTQLEPDIRVSNDYKEMLRGNDQQIAAAVMELLSR
jgi:tricorn protease